MKKTLLISILVLFVGLVPQALAASGFVPIAGIPGLTSNIPATEAGLASFFNNLYKYLIGIAACLAVIIIIYEGIRIATNQDSVSVLMDGKGRIWQAIFGLVLVLSPAVIFNIINPSILNLSLNLPELKSISVGSTNPSAQSAATQENYDKGSKGYVTGTKGVLMIGDFSSTADANAWAQSCIWTSSIYIGKEANGRTIVSCSRLQGIIFVCHSGECPGDSTFIDESGATVRGDTINDLRPVTQSSEDSINGSHAMSFASICSGNSATKDLGTQRLGWKTCINEKSGKQVTCPSGVSSSEKCYKATLSCIPSTDAINCSFNPSWVIYKN